MQRTQAVYSLSVLQNVEGLLPIGFDALPKPQSEVLSRRLLVAVVQTMLRQATADAATEDGKAASVLGLIGLLRPLNFLEALRPKCPLVALFRSLDPMGKATSACLAESENGVDGVDSPKPGLPARHGCLAAGARLSWFQHLLQPLPGTWRRQF